jgi:hypothetical protein
MFLTANHKRVLELAFVQAKTDKWSQSYRDRGGGRWEAVKPHYRVGDLLCVLLLQWMTQNYPRLSPLPVMRKSIVPALILPAAMGQGQESVFLGSMPAYDATSNVGFAKALSLRHAGSTMSSAPGSQLIDVNGDGK